eukprot:scaffold20356_cov125-Isochrysis_galbana.AAC.6
MKGPCVQSLRPQHHKCRGHRLVVPDKVEGRRRRQRSEHRRRAGRLVGARGHRYPGVNDRTWNTDSAPTPLSSPALGWGGRVGFGDDREAGHVVKGEQPSHLTRQPLRRRLGFTPPTASSAQGRTASPRPANGGGGARVDERLHAARHRQGKRLGPFKLCDRRAVATRAVAACGFAPAPPGLDRVAPRRAAASDRLGRPRDRDLAGEDKRIGLVQHHRAQLRREADQLLPAHPYGAAGVDARARRGDDDGAGGLAHRLGQLGSRRRGRRQQEGALRAVVRPRPLDCRRRLQGELARRHHHKKLAGLGHVEPLQKRQQVSQRLARPGRRVEHCALAAVQPHHRRLLNRRRLGHALLAQHRGGRRLERQVSKYGERRAQHRPLRQERRPAARRPHGQARREQARDVAGLKEHHVGTLEGARVVVAGLFLDHPSTADRGRYKYVLTLVVEGERAPRAGGGPGKRRSHGCVRLARAEHAPDHNGRLCRRSVAQHAEVVLRKAEREGRLIRQCAQRVVELLAGERDLPGHPKLGARLKPLGALQAQAQPVTLPVGADRPVEPQADHRAPNEEVELGSEHAVRRNDELGDL